MLRKLYILAKLIIPFGAVMGLVFTLNIKKQVPVHFAFPASVLVIIFCLQLGGYINYLEQTAVLMYIIGWGMLFMSAHHTIKSGNFFKTVFSAPVMIVLFACAVCIIFYKDYFFMHPDEFNHWGIVIKELVSLDCFPDSRSIISFKGYTLSSALFVYFFLNSTGFSQPLAYMAQGFMNIMGLAVLLKGASWKKPWSVFISLIAVIGAVIAFPISIQYLLVDFLVAVYGAFLLILSVEYSVDSEKTDPVKLIFLSVPLTIGLAFIKISAFVYYILFIIVVLYFRHKKGWSYRSLSRKQAFKLICSAGAPVIAYLLWCANVNRVYADSNAYSGSAFGFSVSKLMNTASEKNIPQIIFDLATSFFSQKIAIIAMIIAVAALRFLAWLKKHNEDDTLMKRIVAVSIISWLVFFVFYGASIIFMFSQNELTFFDTSLIAYERYLSTPTGVLVIMFLYRLLSYAQNIKMKKVSLFSVAACTVFLFFFGYAAQTCERVSMSAENIKQYMQLQKDCREIPVLFSREDNLLCYTGEYIDDQSIYNNYYISSELMSKNIANFSNYTVEGGVLKESTLNYYMFKSKYLIVLSKNEKLADILRSVNAVMDIPDGRIYSINILDKGGYSLIKLG